MVIYAGQMMLGEEGRTGAIGFVRVGFVMVYLWWKHRTVGAAGSHGRYRHAPRGAAQTLRRSDPPAAHDAALVSGAPLRAGAVGRGPVWPRLAEWRGSSPSSPRWSSSGGSMFAMSKSAHPVGTRQNRVDVSTGVRKHASQSRSRSWRNDVGARARGRRRLWHFQMKGTATRTLRRWRWLQSGAGFGSHRGHAGLSDGDRSWYHICRRIWHDLRIRRRIRCGIRPQEGGI